MSVQLHFYVEYDAADFPHLTELFVFGSKCFLLIINVHSSIALRTHRSSLQALNEVIVFSLLNLETLLKPSLTFDDIFYSILKPSRLLH